MRSPVNLLVLSVGLSLALAASGTAQTPKPLRVTIPVIGMNFLPLFVAADKGMFAKEGFDVEIISTSGDGPDVDALIAGSVQFTVSTPNRLLTSYEQGKPLLAIMNMANRNAIDCVINKDVAARVGITEDTPLDQKLRALKGLNRLLKNVLERSGCAKLIQHSGPWRTKDSAPRGPGFENCASLIPSRVFQQPAKGRRDSSTMPSAR